MAKKKAILQHSVKKKYILFLLIISISCFTMSIIDNIKFSIILFFVGWLLVGILNIYSQSIVQSIVDKDKIGLCMG